MPCANGITGTTTKLSPTSGSLSGIPSLDPDIKATKLGPASDAVNDFTLIGV